MAIELDATKHNDHGPMGYCGYTNEQLHAAFKLVQNPQLWKMPIVYLLHEPTQAQLDLIEAAVRFFAGSTALFVSLANGNVRVTAPGYYVCIGA